jgi:hypothetical protein
MVIHLHGKFHFVSCMICKYFYHFLNDILKPKSLLLGPPTFGLQAMPTAAAVAAAAATAKIQALDAVATNLGLVCSFKGFISTTFCVILSWLAQIS